MTHKPTLITFVGAVLVTLLVGCASVPPRDLIDRNDHAGLVSWYQEEAKALRSRAEEMRQMAKDYERRKSKPGGPPSELVRHCLSLVERYTKAAEEADAMAQLHKNQLGG